MSTIQTARQVSARHQVRRKEQLRTKKSLKLVKACGRAARRTASASELPFSIFVISVSILTAGIIVHVAQQALVSQLSFEIENVKKEIQLAEQTQEQLLAQKAALESPQRIETIATGKLSMVKAPKISYLRIVTDAPGGTAGAPAVGAPVDTGLQASGSRIAQRAQQNKGVARLRAKAAVAGAGLPKRTASH